MPNFSAKKLSRRGMAVALGATIAAGAATAALPATALASHNQVAIIQDNGDLTNPDATFQEFRHLGASTVRVIVPWALIAPNAGSTRKPSHFNATDPNAYPARNWALYDLMVQAAKKYGLTLDFTVSGGAPRWAELAAPPGVPRGQLPYYAWEPSASAFGQFVKAIGTRYDGHFTPKGSHTALPAVRFWAIYNEPNFGEDLGPQATHGSSVATGPMMFRGLVEAGWNALRASGHSHDTIIWGEFAARGRGPQGPSHSAPQGRPGFFDQTKPLIFLRDLYCVDSGYRPLRGYAASSIGCPTNAAGTRAFRARNPALFNASGVSDHPYPGGESPVSHAGDDPNFASFPDLGNLERVLDRVNRVYGSHKRFTIYNTEYGYITSPPKGAPYVSPSTAAYYINWAEYLSWRQPRVASTMQYLLIDPPSYLGPVYAGFASGLKFVNGTPKPGYDAYRLPIYMPTTSFSGGSSVELWGNARPAPFMVADGDGPQTVSVQLNGQTVKTVTVNGSNSYFDLRMQFPHSGSVRLAYTYPGSDPLLPVGDLGKTVYSRSIQINVH